MHTAIVVQYSVVYLHNCIAAIMVPCFMYNSRAVSVSLLLASSAEAVDATTAKYTLTAAATPQASPRSSVHHTQQQQQQRRNSSELVAAAIGDAVAALTTIRDTGATVIFSGSSSGDVCRLYVSDATHPGYPAQRVDIKVRVLS
jgi:hypothetical protein